MQRVAIGPDVFPYAEWDGECVGAGVEDEDGTSRLVHMSGRSTPFFTIELVRSCGASCTHAHGQVCAPVGMWVVTSDALVRTYTHKHSSLPSHAIDCDAGAGSKATSVYVAGARVGEFLCNQFGPSAGLEDESECEHAEDVSALDGVPLLVCNDVQLTVDRLRKLLLNPPHEQCDRAGVCGESVSRNEEAWELLMELINNGKVRDIILLDMLIQISRGERSDPRSFDDIVHDHLGMSYRSIVDDYSSPLPPLAPPLPQPSNRSACDRDGSATVHVSLLCAMNDALEQLKPVDSGRGDEDGADEVGREGHMDMHMYLADMTKHGTNVDLRTVRLPSLPTEEQCDEVAGRDEVEGSDDAHESGDGFAEGDLRQGNEVHEDQSNAESLALGGGDNLEEPGDIRLASGSAPTKSLELSDVTRVEEKLLVRAICGTFAYRAMYRSAIRTSRLHTDKMHPNALEKYGVLTEVVQVKGAVALHEVERQGIPFDRELKPTALEYFERKLKRDALRMVEFPFAQGLIRFDLEGNMVMDAKYPAKPFIDHQRLQEIVLFCVSELEHNEEFLRVEHQQFIATDQLRDLKENTLSLLKFTKYAEYSPFIAAWSDFEKSWSGYSLVATFPDDRDVIYPKIQKCLRNGRVSYREQMIPRDCALRHLFRASPGHVLMYADYNFIELCTLAALCEHNYHYSMLARVIREGIDPHSFTAAQLLNSSLEEFLQLKDSDDEQDIAKFKKWRKAAKIINFATASGRTRTTIPGISWDRAQEFRQKLVTSIYPEMRVILRDDVLVSVARNLGCPPEHVRKELAYHGRWNRGAISSVADVVAGKKYGERHGYPLSKKWKNQVWGALKSLNRNPRLAGPIANRRGSEEFYEALFGKSSVTLTGRVRAKATYNSGLNSLFSGLAADGAKLALWNLHHVGYRIVGFLHDEIILEVEEGCDYEHEMAMVSQIMEESMKDVIPSMPVGCEVELARCWCPVAKKVSDDQGRRIPYDGRACNAYQLE